MPPRKSTPAILALAFLLTAIMGCSTSAPPIPAPVYPNVTGNWEFQVEIPISSPPTTSASLIQKVFGSLTSNAGHVTGTLNASTGLIVLPGGTPTGPGVCVAPNADLAVTGTVDPSGDLNLTMPISGGVGTLTVVASPTSLGFSHGTFQVVGGACAQASNALLAFQVPNVTGTYTGTLTQLIIPAGPSPVGPLSVTAILVQASAPNADGQYPLTGTITATGGCSATLSFNQGIVYGAEFQSFANPSNLLPVTGLFFLGNAGPGNAHGIIVTFEDASACGAGLFNGVLLPAP
jgi:hypothetical protein